MSEFLKISTLKISFKDKVLTRNFNLTFNEFDKVALIGPSGQGKSSVINAIMGFIPFEGFIYYKGELLTKHNIETFRAKVAWLPQNPSIIGRGNVLELIKKPFTFKANHNNIPDDATIVHHLEALGLQPEILSQDFVSISGGEKQKIGLIICKLLKKELLLLDEPVSGMDKENAAKAARYILDDPGITVLSTSHNEIWSSACGIRHEFRDLI